MTYSLPVRLALVLLLAALHATMTLAASAPAPSMAHRSGCHRHHTCPSDHATYVWRGLRCVKPSSPKRNSSFRRKVRYDGRTYYCKRA